jgi:hypothetical protein
MLPVVGCLCRDRFGTLLRFLGFVLFADMQVK